MRIAIAGSRSMLAHALAGQCEAAGWEATLLGRGPDAGIHFDATAPVPAIGDLTGREVMVVCASSFGGDTLEGMRENLQVNVLGALALLEASARDGIGRLVFVSSISALDARDSYGLSKATAERVLRQACSAQNVELTIVRPAQIYDAEGLAAKHQPFLYHVIDKVAAGQDVTLFGAVDVERNYVHLDDVAHALLACVRDRLVGAFNAVHPETLRVSEAAEIIRREFASASRVVFDADKPDMAQIAIPAEGNLFDTLGLSPRPFSEGMRQIRALRCTSSVAAL